ncbi:head-tail connector protein [Oceanicella sp. SM1341]|uniref:head-tail connector protein n=1 Tax=Oceanicella sp. SM1341 TaxID=1548889 RepID=UPI000E49D67B|nr:head-tail connector protein [Oceanicella sp. SM1341]
MMLTELEPPVLGTKAVRDLADHLRLGSGFADDGAQDALIELYLRTAMAAIEARIGKALVQRAFSWTVTRWRETGRQALPIAPVRQVTTVRIVSASGTEQETDSSLWVLVPDGQAPSLQGSWGRALPGIPDLGRAEIEFSAGYAVSWEELPADLRQATLLLAASYYENRSADEGREGALPFGVLALLDPYRPVRL